MLKGFFIIIFILFQNSLMVAEEKLIYNQMHLAEAYLETGQIDQARAIYENILTEDLPSWERAIVVYNIGTTLLAQGLWDQALDQFKSIPITESSNPILVRNVKYNIAYTSLQQAEKRAAEIKETDADFIDSSNEIILLLKDALTSISHVKKNDCEIFQLEEGLIKNKNFHCPTDEKLILIKAQIKSISTKLLSKENRYENTHFAFSEEITLLHDLNQSLKEMTFLLNPTLSPEIKVNYLKEEIRDRTIELSKWKEQEKAIFNIPEKERQKTRITKDAEELYKKGIEFLTESLSLLKSEKLAESQKLLEQARDSLKTFLLQVLSDNPLESILEMVILDYEDALIINPLIEQPLLELQLALQDVEKVGQKFSDKIQEHLTYTRQTQQLSLEALKQNKPETARIFLREGYFAVQEALELLKVQKDQTPINVLKYGLQEQKQAEELVSAAYKLIPIEGISPDLTKTLIHGQMDPINAVKDFISTVLLQEKTIFLKHGQDPEKACQDKPWDEVIPLFQQGYETALEAYQELQSNNPPWTSILQNQQNTIISWQMAIDKMAAHESESKQKQQQQQQQEQNPPPPNNPPGNAQPLSIEQKMRLLEQMEQEDKIQPLTHPPTSFKEVKPW